jgi:hypothetical protein
MASMDIAESINVLAHTKVPQVLSPELCQNIAALASYGLAAKQRNEEEKALEEKRFKEQCAVMERMADAMDRISASLESKAAT